MNGFRHNKFEYIYGVLSINIPDQYIGLISEPDIEKMLKDIDAWSLVGVLDRGLVQDFKV
jgi:hypothetical protein